MFITLNPDHPVYLHSISPKFNYTPSGIFFRVIEFGFLGNYLIHNMAGNEMQVNTSTKMDTF